MEICTVATWPARAETAVKTLPARAEAVVETWPLPAETVVEIQRGERGNMRTPVWKLGRVMRTLVWKLGGVCGNTGLKRGSSKVVSPLGLVSAEFRLKFPPKFPQSFRTVSGEFPQSFR